MNNTVNTILFDLDGTLIDTAPDLANALNLLLIENNIAAIDFETIRPLVSHGSPALIKLGFGLSAGDTNYEPLRLRFLELYEQNIAHHSQLFAGVTAVIEYIEQRQWQWGIVTNKPYYLAKQLLQQMELIAPLCALVGGDTLAVKKPDPAPILLACEQAKVNSSQCIYVGDAHKDIQAGQAAGMPAIAALYGYIAEQENPSEWQADHYVESAVDIIDCLKQY